MRVLSFNYLFSDPPPAVNFIANQYFNEIVILWTRLPDEPCPIIEYTITINGSTVTVNRNDNQYSRPISDSECGSTLEITMSATSAAGTAETTSMNLPTVATRELMYMGGDGY